MECNFYLLSVITLSISTYLHVSVTHLKFLFYLLFIYFAYVLSRNCSDIHEEVKGHPARVSSLLLLCGLNSGLQALQQVPLPVGPSH